MVVYISMSNILHGFLSLVFTFLRETQSVGEVNLEVRYDDERTREFKYLDRGSVVCLFGLAE